MKGERNLLIIFKNGSDQRAFGMFNAESAEKFLKENNFQKILENRYEMKISEEKVILASIVELEIIFPFFDEDRSC